MKQMQDTRIQDSGSTLWERLSSRDLPEGWASAAFRPASWILHPESAPEDRIEHPVSSIGHPGRLHA
jgi:hypothetical protein